MVDTSTISSPTLSARKSSQVLGGAMCNEAYQKITNRQEEGRKSQSAKLRERLAGSGFSIPGACTGALLEGLTCGGAYYFKLSSARHSFLYALLAGTIAFLSIATFGTVSKGRYIDWPMALSSYIFVVPAMAMWSAGFPAFGISIAYIAGSATAADAMRPFSNGDRNTFWYSFDVVLTTSNFVWCILTAKVYIQCAFSHFKRPYYPWLFVAWCVFVWAMPLGFWKWSGDVQEANKQQDGKQAAGTDPEAWRPYHMLWHVVAITCCTIGNISGKYACEYSANTNTSV